MSRPLVINQQYTIPAYELLFTFARSSGPGGQNVNKVNSKAVLHWSVANSSTLSPAIKQRVLSKYRNRVNQHGQLVLSSDTHREQGRNVTACLTKLRELILAALAPPRRRIKTKPSRGAVERRLQSKREQAQRKQQRRYRPDDR